MEYAGRGIEAEVLVGCYSGGQPAFGCGPFDAEHVVGEGSSEDELVVGGYGFRGCGGGYREAGEVDGG